MLTTKSICIYHQLHQPFRVNISQDIVAQPEDFFVGPFPGKNGGDFRNETIFEKVAISSYIPSTHYWLDMLMRHPELQVTLSFSGTFLEQCLRYEKYGNQVINNLQALVGTGRVELLAETYYHSLSFLYDLEEFLEQVSMHMKLIKLLFNYNITSFRNTEVIYNDHIAEIIRQLGFKTIVASKALSYVDNKSRNYAIARKPSLTHQELSCIEKYKHSEPLDDITVLFNETKLTRSIFLMERPDEAREILFTHKGNLITLFTDFEIYGEHNDNETGILETMEKMFVDAVSANMKFITVSQAGEQFKHDAEEYSSEVYTTWANTEHDLRSWVGHHRQNISHTKLIQLLTRLKPVLFSEDSEHKKLLEMWRKLSTSDHFYYMPDLIGPDSVIHEMFSPYESPIDAHNTFMNAIKFLENELDTVSLKHRSNLLPVAKKVDSIFD